MYKITKVNDMPVNIKGGINTLPTDTRHAEKLDRLFPNLTDDQRRIFISQVSKYAIRFEDIKDLDSTEFGDAKMYLKMSEHGDSIGYFNSKAMIQKYTSGAPNGLIIIEDRPKGILRTIYAADPIYMRSNFKLQSGKAGFTMMQLKKAFEMLKGQPTFTIPDPENIPSNAEPQFQRWTTTAKETNNKSKSKNVGKPVIKTRVWNKLSEGQDPYELEDE